MLIFRCVFYVDGKEAALNIWANDELHALLVFEYLFGFGPDSATEI